MRDPSRKVFPLRHATFFEGLQARDGASIEWQRRSLRLLHQEVLHDLPAGGAPYAGVRADVFERGVESADPMRLAGDEGVDRDRHDARDRFALAVKGVELASQHRLEFRHRYL